MHARGDIRETASFIVSLTGRFCNKTSACRSDHLSTRYLSNKVFVVAVQERALIILQKDIKHPGNLKSNGLETEGKK